MNHRPQPSTATHSGGHTAKPAGFQVVIMQKSIVAVRVGIRLLIGSARLRARTCKLSLRSATLTAAMMIVSATGWSASRHAPTEQVYEMSPGQTKRVAVHSRVGTLVDSDCADKGVDLTVVVGTRRVNWLEIAWDADKHSEEGVDCLVRFGPRHQMQFRLKSTTTNSVDESHQPSSPSP